MGRRTANLGIYVPVHAEIDWDDSSIPAAEVLFDRSLDGLDALLFSGFYTSTPIANSTDWQLWKFLSNKRGYVYPVDEVATSPTGSEIGNDGWRVLINGVGAGAFVGHDNEVAVWDDTLTVWDFQAANINGNWIFDIDTESQFYFKNSEWNNPLGITSFDDAGSTIMEVADNGVKVVTLNNAQPDTDYRAFASGNAIGQLHIKNKTNTTFEVHAQTSAWIGNIDWTLTRKDDTASDKNDTATIVADGVIQVTFADAFLTTNYRIILTPSMNAGMHWSDRLATGFKINASSSLVTGDVDWIAKYGS